MAFEDKKKSYMDTLFSISTLLKRWQIEIQNKDVDNLYVKKAWTMDRTIGKSKT